MLLLDEADGCGKNCVAGEKERLGIAVAEGGQPGDPAEERWGDVRKGKLGVVFERRDEERGGEARAGVGADARAEEGKAIGGEGEADGVGMAAETMEERCGLRRVMRLSVPGLRCETRGTQVGGGQSI